MKENQMYLYLLCRRFSFLLIPFFVAAIFLSSCVDTRLGFSDYYFRDVKTPQKWVLKKDGKSGGHTVIGPSIVALEITLSGASFVRQVVNFYDCDDQTIEAEVLDKFEYYIIHYKADKVIGPMTEDQFKNMVMSYEALDLPGEAKVRQSMRINPKKLMACNNPKLIPW